MIPTAVAPRQVSLRRMGQLPESIPLHFIPITIKKYGDLQAGDFLYEESPSGGVSIDKVLSVRDGIVMMVRVSTTQVPPLISPGEENALPTSADVLPWVHAYRDPKKMIGPILVGIGILGIGLGLPFFGEA